MLDIWGPTHLRLSRILIETASGKLLVAGSEIHLALSSDICHVDIVLPRFLCPATPILGWLQLFFLHSGISLAFGTMLYITVTVSVGQNLKSVG